MNPIWDKSREVVLRIVTKAISGPGFIASAIHAANLAVLHALVKLFDDGLAEDIARLKEEGFRRLKTKGDLEVAKVREQVAKAVDAENKANLLNRNDRIAKAEERKKLAEAAETDKVAQAKLVAAQAEREKARAEAFIKLLEAITNLQKSGGRFAVNIDQLYMLLGISDPSELSLGLSDSPSRKVARAEPMPRGRSRPVKGQFNRKNARKAARRNAAKKRKGKGRTKKSGE